MPGFPADQFTPFREVEPGYKTFPGRDIRFWKQEIKADAQEDIRDNQEDENAHSTVFLVGGKDNRNGYPCLLGEC